MGYVQAHGRNAVAWEDTFKMDVWYTRNISFKTDWEIYWDTVRIVFKREKICSVTSAIREELKDTNCIKELQISDQTEFFLSKYCISFIIQNIIEVLGTKRFNNIVFYRCFLKRKDVFYDRIGVTS